MHVFTLYIAVAAMSEWHIFTAQWHRRIFNIAV